MMKKWEYKTIQESWKKFTETMKTLGEQGWEAVGFDTYYYGSTTYHALLKRELKEKWD